MFVLFLPIFVMDTKIIYSYNFVALLKVTKKQGFNLSEKYTLKKKKQKKKTDF